MTALAPRPLSTRPLNTATDALLRFVLRADATLTGIAGVAIAAFADPLSTVSGLSPTTEYLTGAALVAYGVIVYCLAALPSLRNVGIGVSIANAMCTLATLVIVTADAAPLTDVGIAGVWAAGIYTAVFGYLQYLGVRRLRA